jgi:hypothetical protein
VADEGDHVAGADAERGQAAGDRVDRGRELGVGDPFGATAWCAASRIRSTGAPG